MSYPPSFSSFSPSLSHSPSHALFPYFYLALSHALSLSLFCSLALCEEGEEHQRPSHSNSTCNRVQTAPSVSLLLLSDSHPSQRTAAGGEKKRSALQQVEIPPSKYLRKKKEKVTGRKEENISFALSQRGKENLEKEKRRDCTNQEVQLELRTK